MLKVFLVEDEIVMREGIRKSINWAQEGFEFVGEASDGELAYPLIQKTRPDILLTDIKMPFMDGLELSRLIKQEMPDIKIIILSGYDDFEYAREGISIGITDYLVKPISASSLLEAIKKVEKIILEEQEQKKYLQKFEQDRLEDIRIARQKFFNKLVSGKMQFSAALKEGKEIGINLAADQYNILLFQLFSEEKQDGYSEEENDVTEAIEALVSETPGVVMFELGLDGWAFLLKQEGEKSLQELESEFLEVLQDTIRQKNANLEYFGGIGEPVGRLSELQKCYDRANQAFAWRYLAEHNQIIHNTKPENTVLMDENLTLIGLNVDKLNRKVVENFLRTGLQREVVHFIEEYLNSLGEKNVGSLLFRQYVLMDIYFAAAGMLEQLGYPQSTLVESCGDIQSMTLAVPTVEQSKQYIRKVLEAAIELREKQSRQKYRFLLEDAKNYIEQNYDNEEISLNTVAASVNLSPNHFSTIFSQETGQTFIEYLTSVRMEKAKELLRSTSMRTADIAFAVGYKDPHYFSYLFKKTQECTPREFRSRA